MDVSNPLLADIDIIPYKEKQLILNDFNATETEYPRDKTVVELFEEQVRKHLITQHLCLGIRSSHMQN